MPTPESAISTTIEPSCARMLDMTTCESGGEKFVALSSSSASRWMTSLVARPTTVACGGACTTIRWYCSISETAARSTSTSGTGATFRLARSVPASTSRFSLLRRIRVARWSSWKRLDSWSGSCSLLSSCSISCSWRSTSAWLRRDRFTNMLLTLLCSAAWSAASLRACPCTVSKARATCPTSSRVCSGTGSTVTSGTRARAHALHRLRQPPLRDVQGRGAQNPQRAGQRSDHQHDDRDGEQQAEHEDHGVDPGEVARPVLRGVTGGDQRRADLRLRLVQDRGDCATASSQPGGDRDRARRGRVEDGRLDRVALGVRRAR